MKRTPEEILERMDALLDEYDGAKDKFDRGQFADKFGERLGAYSDKLKLLNGDDFDIVNSAYDEHKSDYSDMSDDDYVNALEENIKSVIAKIWPEKSEEEVAKVAEEVAENAEPTETTVEVTEETPSDEKLKKGKEDPVTSGSESADFSLIKERGDDATGAGNGWGGSPHTSGGRNGTTSDENSKEPPSEEEKKLDEVVEATPTKVDDVVKEVLEAKPEDVESEDDADFEKLKNDPVYKRMH